MDLLLQQVIDSYYAARLAAEEAKAASVAANKLMKGKEAAVIDAMLGEGLTSLKRDDGTSPTLRRNVDISVTVENTEDVRKWLRELDGEVIEQFWVGGEFSQGTEVARGADERASEDFLPEAVDHDTGGKWILWIG